MESIVSPILLFVLLALGGLGTVMALPRRGVNPQLLGGVLAVAGLLGVLVSVGITAAAELTSDSIWFYVFGAIALGSAIRVISHPKPVYSALYFILTVLSSSALYLLMGAEFMAFALVIIYAGAILITYLFVIMLATQAPTEQERARLSGYDAYAREPVAAVLVGFILLAALSGLYGRGVGELKPTGSDEGKAFLANVPGRVIDALARHGAFTDGRLLRNDRDAGYDLTDAVASQRENLAAGVVELRVGDAEAVAAGVERGGRFATLFQGDQLDQVRSAADVPPSVVLTLPPDLRVENIDLVGWALIAGHPMALELAGVILTMAMLGAVVLARKQVELTEDEKAAQANAPAGDFTASVGGGL